ncbi:MAG: hypothetical protein H6737_09335 [Alphaproteobacteria bacterium]|nr:hypothetical protein [Alphaproteobacteria bacterium]
MKHAGWLLLLIGCAGGEPVETDTDPVVDTDTDVPLQPVWRDGVQAMFAVRCAPCHTGYDFGGVQVNTRGDLVDVPSSTGMAYITPGSLEDSYVWHKIEDTHHEVGGDGERMPLDTAPLDADETALLSDWILAGAPLQ